MSATGAASPSSAAKCSAVSAGSGAWAPAAAVTCCSQHTPVLPPHANSHDTCTQA
jgi:hypothetical protein